MLSFSGEKMLINLIRELKQRVRRVLECPEEGQQTERVQHWSIIDAAYGLIEFNILKSEITKCQSWVLHNSSIPNLK